MTVLLAVCLLLAAAGVAFAVQSRVQAARTLRRVERMLRAAENGTLVEQSFDETRLSALESRFRGFLYGWAAVRRSAEAEKVRTQAMVTDIAHQLKTPVANLVLYTQLLSERQLPEDCRTLADTLAGQADKLRFLADTLVRMSQMETGLLQMHPRTGLLLAVVCRAAELALPKFRARGISLVLPDADATAVFDGKWTAEAVGNLLDNAAKYAPSGSTVTVALQQNEMFCRIDVADQGPGIPEAEQSRIFQRFYRSPSVAEQEGMGVGLYLAREIAAAQGGYLKVSSRLGTGSVFSIYLPRDRQEIFQK